MPLDVTRTRQYLKSFNFKSLFIEELGWDYHTVQLEVTIEGQKFNLLSIAQKRGMVAFTCSSIDSGMIPGYPIRRKIERQVAKSFHEHLIIYIDNERKIQIWQWVKREVGKPTQCREHTYYSNQLGDALIQKLQSLAFSLEEEEGLTIVDVTSRVRAGFDVDRVTRRFYERFKSEHDAFLKFLKGIPDEEMQRWYASVMLNRLMFIYFIQKKGFLDNNINYLLDKLNQFKSHGKDRFYKDFLCPLFFDGFAKKEHERKPSINQLLGKVPFLNGGIFQPHQLEELYGRSIHIADSAFEKLFSFFDQYQWHLDERPLRKDNEINPDVLGYIFEKYVNQKQMGAYYTKEDITEYISKNTIIPYLFDEAKRRCKIAFEGEKSIWRLLKNDPDRYIYEAVKKGVDLPLPEEIAVGLNDVSKRTEWNKPAPSEYALPTEIWREVVARRKRYEEIHTKLENGEIQDINDLITYNLNIRQFAQDVIENCENPDLLRAFWHTIEEVTVLDPTCGSGAFLFAALNILEPLYEACLERMEVFLDELDRSGEKHRPEKFSDFRKVLDQIKKHPNLRYFIFKSIIVNNLYGVDIMEEAIEICKLRLFLKLVAQVEVVDQIESLPDIDFNIRAGNTLVGFATYDEVKRAVTTSSTGQLKMQYDNTMQRIDQKAQDVDRLFTLFRQQQTEIGGEVTPADKQELGNRLKALEDELNQYLAGEYGIDPTNKNAYQKWLSSHKPFHWFIEFYGILKKGGFDVIIGNPPFLEVKDVDYKIVRLSSVESGAVHAICVERGLQLLGKLGCISMIFPMSLVSTQRMVLIQHLLEDNRATWYSNFAWRPSKLFDEVNRAISFFISIPDKFEATYCTGYQRWTADARDFLVPKINYTVVHRNRNSFWVPKLQNYIEIKILEKNLSAPKTIGDFVRNSNYKIYYRTTGGLYWKVFTDFPPKFRINGVKSHSSRENWFSLSEKELVLPIIAVLSSNLFWWWYTITSNLRDLNPSDIYNFHIPNSIFVDQKLKSLGKKYLDDLLNNSVMHVRVQKQTGKTETQLFKVQKSKPIIDEIDRVLAQHYGFTDEELDFIINYDIKYRMGLGGKEIEEEN